MNDVGKMVAAIEQQGREAANEILERGKERAEILRGKYQRRSEEIAQSARLEAERFCCNAREQIEEACALELEKYVLEEKQKWIGDVFDTLQEQMKKWPAEQICGVLTAVISCEDMTRCDVLLLKESNRRYGRKLAAALKKSGIDATLLERSEGGEGAVFRNENMVIDATFATLLQPVRRRLESRVAALLFEESERV